MRLYNNSYIGDWLIILLILNLFFIGLAVLYSSTKIISNEYFKIFFLKQVLGIFFGLIFSFLVSKISYKKIINWGSTLHYLTLILLILTLLKGSIGMGAKRWINFGFFKAQPSELCKITLPLWILNFFSKNILEEFKEKDWLKTLLMIGITGFLIFKQQDLGSALVICLSSFIMIYIAGLPKNIIYFLLILFSIITPLFWKFIFHDYQKKRVLVFLGYGSEHKERYQIEQSKIAIGSGGLLGKGFLKGTQKNLKFLPANQTDFIFSVLAEEFGFVGISLVLLLYILIIIRLQVQLYFIDEIYAYILSLGIFLPFIISAIGNIGMVAGLFPVVGIPLPGMSYGISHTWSSCLMIGILNGILKEKND